MPPVPDFAAHRRALLRRLQPDEAVLLPGAPVALRARDIAWRYRPDPDVYRLTGWTRPGVVVLLRPGPEPLTLFTGPGDPAHGHDAVIPPAGVCALTGADAAWPLGELAERLEVLLQGVARLHYPLGREPDLDRLVLDAVARPARPAARAGADLPDTFHALSRLVHEERLVKHPGELAAMEGAARLTAAGLSRARELTAPGVHEQAVQAAVDQALHAPGGAGPAFPTIVAGGPRACEVHPVHSRGSLARGELVLVDAGAELHGYACDVTRTWAVDGRPTPAQVDLHQAVLTAWQAGVDACAPGRTFHQVQEGIQQALAVAAVELGLLPGPVDAVLEGGALRRYAPHVAGHWIGLDVHDPPAYARSGRSRVLEPGVTLTVEPGLYVPPGDQAAPPALRGLGVRIEDVVAVTRGRPRVLTGDIPRDIA